MKLKWIVNQQAIDELLILESFTGVQRNVLNNESLPS